MVPGVSLKERWLQEMTHDKVFVVVPLSAGSPGSNCTYKIFNIALYTINLYKFILLFTGLQAQVHVLLALLGFSDL